MTGYIQTAKAEVRAIAQRTLFKNIYRSSSSSQTQPPNNSSNNKDQGPYNIREPTPLDIIRHRYHWGTNLGSVFVIERWMTESRFPPGAEGSSELAAVKAWVEKIGIVATQRKFEDAWANAVTDEDIQWLVKAKCTTIRLPIGYFDLPGTNFTQGTPFEPYAQVYSAAWYYIRLLIQRLRTYSIGVLVDLHALPGGANGGDHSGTNSGKAELWQSTFDRALGLKCCRFLARDALTGSDIAGIQIVNEAGWEAPGMYEWYDECLAAISVVDPTIPVIISDGWNLDKAVSYTLGKNSAYPEKPTAPVVIDTHYYWAFTDDDKKKSPQQITAEVGSKLKELDGREGFVLGTSCLSSEHLQTRVVLRRVTMHIELCLSIVSANYSLCTDLGAVQAIVGEWSCVLTEDSWKLETGSRNDSVKAFGLAQSKRYQDRAGGSFFWTWKFGQGDGGEWGFKPQSDAANIVPPKHALLSQSDRMTLLQKATKERDSRRSSALHAHIDYWNRQDPKGTYEHEKYEQGWQVGYNDAFTFLEGRATQGDKIGMREIWILKRIKESGYRGGFIWEFEQGMRKGMQDFYSCVGL